MRWQVLTRTRQVYVWTAFIVSWASDGETVNEEPPVARMKKPSGRLSSGPWTAADFDRALRSGGWEIESRGPHNHYVHPDRPGRKIQIDQKWTGVKVGHDAFKGVAEQSGYGRGELKRLMNQR
jgi:predicted RNA binding protein YcfA (HicA-like mRNA interferase family)